jgi:hypothetical protein
MMKFYVTMIRAQRVAWLAGPFESKAEAEAQVPAAREAAIKISEWHHFDAFGVTKIERAADAPERPWFPGKLNSALGLDIAA